MFIIFSLLFTTFFYCNLGTKRSSKKNKTKNPKTKSAVIRKPTLKLNSDRYKILFMKWLHI